MYEGQARIIVENRESARVAASAARISTTRGSAIELFIAERDADKDLRLIKKVLASGHKSLMEHQNYTIAFDGVSVLVEQFIIEHRLAAYTVKSRRYVDYSGAGYVVPEELEGDSLAAYRSGMDKLFQIYEELSALGVPKEDARFVLPYAFRSNFYMTANARELMRLIEEMRGGRGAFREEIRALGRRLAEQFERLYPGLLSAEAKAFKPCRPSPIPETLARGAPAAGRGELISATREPAAAIENAMAFSGRFARENGEYLTERNLLALISDSRPRELEFVAATFMIKDISLACLTHFTRHRMQSLLAPDVTSALSRGDYVMPESVSQNPRAREIYESAFESDYALAHALRGALRPQSMAYLALSGHVIDITLSMNARELLHFMKLRTCARAQWEIRGVARDMLEKLREYCDKIFWAYGPSCMVDGRCPEGKLSCGKPQSRGGSI